MDQVIIIKSAETGTTIKYDRVAGTALSLEDGVFYTAEEMLNYQDRKRLTGKGVSRSEHLEKLNTMEKQKDQVKMFCKTFGGKIVTRV